MAARSMRSTCSGTKVATPDEAKLVVHGVVCGYLPKIEWRLSAEERRDIRPGDVFVWEDHAANADTGGTSLERWTDGRHWGPSRMRDEFLFYYERESESDDLGYSRDPGTARMISVDPTRYMRDQPQPTGPRAPSLPLNANGALNPNRLIKQAYSVIVIRNGVPSKWHLTTYFTKASLPMLHSVRDIPALRNLRLPEANYIFFKAYKAQVAARAAQSSHSAAAAASFGSPSPPPPTSPYGPRVLPGINAVLPAARTSRSPPLGSVPVPIPVRYATPGLPSPTELSPICYPHRNPEDQRAIQAFQRFSPPRKSP
ncbi:hypothetical protein EXIGLDRAFT_698846 [Exidia glandulosa HHB12029]|uniref:Gti1/Pac2 family-domain-containing protein n=1 Tax=Exidia glandulosa HHB12029 TaxID=1314781 RepID=A0A165MK83_EXIGL|nr:hypothetical protein EXIGLDRAFT_698846 [Exidia glandulosa HHB12029]